MCGMTLTEWIPTGVSALTTLLGVIYLRYAEGKDRAKDRLSEKIEGICKDAKDNHKQVINDIGDIKTSVAVSNQKIDDLIANNVQNFSLIRDDIRELRGLSPKKSSPQ